MRDSLVSAAENSDHTYLSEEDMDHRDHPYTGPYMGPYKETKERQDMNQAKQ